MEFTKEDKYWIRKCINKPLLYTIMVDNDSIEVIQVEEDSMTSVYTFSQFGDDFLIQLLKYFKITAEFM